ncbi:hypothetical protein M2373_002549 [Chryseobacterium sp. JUb7]|nr:hypothetical protein [Chryseobacterium sp. JUb7]
MSFLSLSAKMFIGKVLNIQFILFLINTKGLVKKVCYT